MKTAVFKKLPAYAAAVALFLGVLGAAAALAQGDRVLVGGDPPCASPTSGGVSKRWSSFSR